MWTAGERTQQLTITIGTGTSDRLANVSASYNGHTHTLSIPFYDANIGARYSVTVTGTGKQVFAPQSLSIGSGLAAKGLIRAVRATSPCPTASGHQSRCPLVIVY